MDNASHTGLPHTPLSDFRWDWTLTFIHSVFISLGAAAKRVDPSSAGQLCLGKKTINQKYRVISAVLSVLTRTPGTSSHLQPVSSATVPKDPSKPQRQICRVKASAISASTAGETIRHPWVFASSFLFRKD